MKIELAKTAGFCFGVRRAVETVYEQVKHHQGEKIYTYGPIIHNEEVIKDLRRQGVEVINSEEELEKLEEGVVIIRSNRFAVHGYIGASIGFSDDDIYLWNCRIGKRVRKSCRIFGQVLFFVFACLESRHVGKSKYGNIEGIAECNKVSSLFCSFRGQGSVKLFYDFCLFVIYF